MKPRVSLLVLTLVASLVTLLGPVAAPSGAAASAATAGTAAPRATITLRGLPPRVELGRYLRLNGTITGAEPTQVTAQLRRRGRWVDVAYTRRLNGRYSVWVATPRTPGRVTWRVVATGPGSGRPSLVSRARSTRAIDQRTILTLPETARAGSTVRARLRYEPFLPGQRYLFGQQVNRSTQYIAAGTMPRGGVTIAFTQIATGRTSYQARRPSGGYLTRTLRGLPATAVLPTRRVSSTSNGSQVGTADSVGASVSDDGRTVAFMSTARYAVPGEINKGRALFVKDTTTGALRRMNLRNGHPIQGVSAPAVSGDGRVVAFVAQHAVLLWDVATEAVRQVGTDASAPSISADGRFVAFRGSDGVRLWDRTSGQTRLVAAGGRRPQVDATGDHVVYESVAGVEVWDRAAGTSELVAAGGQLPRTDADASVVAYESGGQVYAVAGGVTTLLSTADGTTPGAGTTTLDAVSADGSSVLMTSDATLTADDVDAPDSDCTRGRTCDNAADVFVADLAAHTIALVSRSSTGAAAERESRGYDLVADGSQVVFGSYDLLVPGQYFPYSGGALFRTDVFVRDLDRGPTTRRVNAAPPGSVGMT